MDSEHAKFDTYADANEYANTHQVSCNWIVETDCDNTVYYMLRLGSYHDLEREKSTLNIFRPQRT